MTGNAIGPKVAHVRRARDSANVPGGGGHTCHWPGCGKAVKPALWGCRAHWYRLPKQLRDAIWQTYRPGQEDSKTPSRAYLAVARRVQDWIAQNYPETQAPETQTRLDL